MYLSIVSLNVNGLREKKKRSSLLYMFRHKKYDIICLQETHCGDEIEANLWSKEWEGYSLWNNGNSQSRGVALLFRKGLEIDYSTLDCWRDRDGRVLSVNCKFENDKHYRLSNVYAPNLGKDRKLFYRTVYENLDQYNDVPQLI